MCNAAPFKAFFYSLELNDFLKNSILGGWQMETRVAIIGIIVEDSDSVDKLNGILHNYGKYIIGRMGLPYRQKGICIISIAVDAPQDIISALSGKLGRLPGISTKTLYSKVTGVVKDEEEN